jgi:hypothetical protein
MFMQISLNQIKFCITLLSKGCWLEKKGLLVRSVVYMI